MLRIQMHKARTPGFKGFDSFTDDLLRLMAMDQNLSHSPKRGTAPPSHSPGGNQQKCPKLVMHSDRATGAL